MIVNRLKMQRKVKSKERQMIQALLARRVARKEKKETSGKKHERKRITDESEDKLSTPGNAEDVKNMMLKVLRDKVDESLLEDILPDPENDFYPHNVDQLGPSEYLASILPKWKISVKKSLFMKKNGSPVLLIVTSSAIRAVELNRQIKDFLDDKSKVAKLFAKHMKVEDQKKFLMKTNCQVGIGTPGRLLLLIKQGVLQLESLVAVVLDWNWRDTKLKRMADIPEVRQDVVMLLKDSVIEAVKGSSCRLALL
ncbi:unnamed protein product [Candidula unifasciata]|uniref:Protein CMSS1 n=1 Tax=Candidula unifasciata TaxID=100452 RepID=A0A8S3ZK23_9EUPU|nr:unnamed protein product [Candidula unifasciata]